jgi:hypothetical protein
MEQQSVFVKEFSITDELGTEHKAILAAVLNVSKYVETFEDVKYSSAKGKDSRTVTSWQEKKVFKTLSLGLAISNPVDIYNYDKGLGMATGRALKPSKQLLEIDTESRGALGKEMIEAILEQQMNFIKKNYSLFLVITNKPVVAKQTTGSNQEH